MKQQKAKEKKTKKTYFLAYLYIVSTYKKEHLVVFVLELRTLAPTPPDSQFLTENKQKMNLKHKKRHKKKTKKKHKNIKNVKIQVQVLVKELSTTKIKCSDYFSASNQIAIHKKNLKNMCKK